MKQSLIAYLTILVFAWSVGNASASVTPLLTIENFGTPTYGFTVQNGTQVSNIITAAPSGSGFNVSGDATYSVNSSSSPFTLSYVVTQQITNVPAGTYYVGENLGIEQVSESGGTGLEKIDPSSTLTYMNSLLQSVGGGTTYGTAPLAYGANQSLPQINLDGFAASSAFTLTAGNYQLVQDFSITIDNVTQNEFITLDLPNPTQLNPSQLGVITPEPASFVVWGLLATGFFAAGVRCHQRARNAPSYMAVQTASLTVEKSLITAILTRGEVLAATGPRRE